MAFWQMVIIAIGFVVVALGVVVAVYLIIAVLKQERSDNSYYAEQRKVNEHELSVLR